MGILRRDDLNELIAKRGGICVSIYLPTHSSMPETQKDPIRFNNLLAQAEAQSLAMGARPAEARELLKPAQSLLEDSDFWVHQADGLAVFISGDGLRAYRLPLTFDELVVVTGRYHIKPLLPIFAFDGSFYILALSQNQARLFQCARNSISELFPQGIPQNLAEALKYDEPERQLQFHTGAGQISGRRAAVFHGHGTGIDDNKDRLLRYCREVDAALRPLFKNETAPLVLASVDYLLPIYEISNTYPHLVKEGLSGNPESLSPAQLHESAFNIVEPYFRRRRARDEAMAKYQQQAGTGRTSIDIREVISAAAAGRVESLFVALGVRRWGVFDSGSGAIELHEDALPGDEDLLDRAAIETLIKGGFVFAVKPEMVPGDLSLAAVYRY